MAFNMLRGGDLNGDQDIKLFMTLRGGVCLGMPQATSLSVLLNVSYHKKQEYTWFRGGDLNGF